ncbi:hypothetical protein J5X84_35565 [Streptosporangiaceae bacterium NEAU-GS5]|nr:hypothetical protein [Streptosporangiaceae bacterium NEAU-GS5]
MDTSIETLIETRKSLHGVAELLLAGPQWRASRDIRLRAWPGGFAAVAAPGFAVAGGLLVAADGAAIGALHGTTYAGLAAMAGVTAGRPEGVYGDGSDTQPTDQITLDATATELIAAAFADGDTALRALDPAGEPILWPEHFDIAITVDEVNYGISPGDQHIPVPYAYVGPWKPQHGDFWNMSFGAARLLSRLGGVEQILDFLTEGRRRAGGS